MTAMANRSRSSVATLSPGGQQLVRERLAAGDTYEAIVAALAADGERISVSALSRFRRQQFEPAKQKIEAAKAAAQDMVGLLKEAGGDLDGMAEQAAQGLFTVLLRRLIEMEAADVTKLSREARMHQVVQLAQRRAKQQADRLDLERERLELAKRELDQRLADFEARRSRARTALGEMAASRELTAEQVAKIKALYDLD